jgi:hypothetical protein
LVAWDGVENHLEKVPTKPLADRAVDMLTTSEDCYVVFANGSVQVSILGFGKYFRQKMEKLF